MIRKKGVSPSPLLYAFFSSSQALFKPVESWYSIAKRKPPEKKVFRWIL